jgi:hypothetical protein
MRSLIDSFALFSLLLQVHGNSSHLSTLLDGSLFDHSRLRGRYNHPFFSIFQLGPSIFTRASMAINYILLVLWCLFGGFPISHVLFGK